MAHVRHLSPALNGKGTDNCHVFDDMTEYANYARGIKNPNGWSRSREKVAECADKVMQGDLSLVDASDRLMAKLEGAVEFETRAMATVDAMTGGVPNIGAYLAGNPLNMRQRRRVMSQAAPLNVIVDLTTSAGISNEAIKRRGACILAFVRIISAIRPVSLYVGTALDHGKVACASAMRVETSPLDLARAAYCMMSGDYQRVLSYAVTAEISEYCGNWPYNNIDFYRRRIHEFWARFLSLEAEDTLAIAPLYLTDEFAEPETWLRRTLAKFGKAVED